MKLEKRLISVFTQIGTLVKRGSIEKGQIVHYRSLVREYEKLQDRYMKHTRNYWSPIRYEESRGKIQ